MDNIMVDVQTGEITNRPYSPDEKADVKARQDKRENERPMREWKESIQATDVGMPRYLEDLITDNPTFTINEYTKTK